jgi:hypothetical protein
MNLPGGMPPREYLRTFAEQVARGRAQIAARERDEVAGR